MSNITSLSDFRTRRLVADRQSNEDALANEGRAAVDEVIGREQLEQRAMEFSARCAELDRARRSALDLLNRSAPGLAVIVGVASLLAADLTVDLLPVTWLLLVAVLAGLGRFASGIGRELKKSGRTPGLAQDSGELRR